MSVQNGVLVRPTFTGRYRCAKRGGGGTVANAAVHTLWNSNATRDFWLVYLSVFREDTLNTYRMSRVSTRGTSGSTLAPDIDMDTLGFTVPIAALDMGAYTVQPTFETPPMQYFTDYLNNGSGIEIRYETNGKGIRIPAGTGLCVWQVSAAGGTVNSSFAWDE